MQVSFIRYWMLCFCYEINQLAIQPRGGKWKFFGSQATHTCWYSHCWELFLRAHWYWDWLEDTEWRIVLGNMIITHWVMVWYTIELINMKHPKPPFSLELFKNDMLKGGTSMCNHDLYSSIITISNEFLFPPTSHLSSSTFSSGSHCSIKDHMLQKRLLEVTHSMFFI